MNLKIGTINLINNEINRKDGIRIDGKNNYEITVNHILKEKFDILGTQELTKNFSKYLTKNLNNYNLYGKYRFGSGLISKLKMINDANESNEIITNHQVIKTYTKHLPFFPNNIKDIIKMLKSKKLSVPRIVTIVILRINNKDICVINTHLDYRFKKTQIRELRVLKKVINKFKKYDIVLTGDFNMDINDDHFIEFIDYLKILNINRVDIQEQTNISKTHNLAIDHIFIPSKWNVLDKGVYELDKVSDHKEVYAIVNWQ